MVKKVLEETKPTEALVAASAPALCPKEEDLDIVDCDHWIKTPPPRAKGTFRVRLKYMGRAKPIPFEDPDLE